MFEIKVTISCPDLVAAAEMLVKALRPAAAEAEAPAEPKKTTKRGGKAKQEQELAPNAMEEPAPQQPVVLPVQQSQPQVMPQAMAQPQVMPQQPVVQPQPPVQTQPMMQPQAMAQPQVMPQQPVVQPQPMMQPPQTMPTQQPVMQPPVTGAPGYTAEQISRAGAELVQTDPTKMQALMAMLQQFGVATIQMLKPEQFGAFANGLRSLGARL